jgi:hypothetical protein
MSTTALSPRRLGEFILNTALPVIFSVFLIFFGSRHFVASLMLIPGMPAITNLHEQLPVAPDALEALIAAEHSSLGLEETATGRGDLGLAEATLAAQASDPKAPLADARQDLARSLALDPGNPYVWTRLTTIDHLLGADSVQIMREWQMAYVTGPNEATLHIPRYSMAISQWPSLSSMDRNNLFTDIRGAWAVNHEAVARSAIDPFTTNVIRAALATDIRSLIEFEKVKAALSAK